MHASSSSVVDIFPWMDINVRIFPIIKKLPATSIVSPSNDYPESSYWNWWAQHLNWFEMLEIANPFSDLHTHSHVCELWCRQFFEGSLACDCVSLGWQHWWDWMCLEVLLSSCAWWLHWFYQTRYLKQWYFCLQINFTFSFYSVLIT